MMSGSGLSHRNHWWRFPWIWFLGLGLSIALPACAQTTQIPAPANAHVTDLRELLLKEAQRSDPDHPDGRNVLLTHFSYVGRLDTQKGRIYVANRRAVLANMPAPRGVNDILFFDRHCRFLGKVNYCMSMPLWCEGARLYLYGDLDGISRPGEGNVIDLAHGFANLRVSHETRYGSSGGTLDE